MSYLHSYVSIYCLNQIVCQTNFYVAKTLTCQLGLDYKTIHACARGCVLFQGEHQNVVHYPKCGNPRYKDEINKMFPIKVLRHFPIVPKFQRMYRSLALLELMLWHSYNCSLDGMIKHPCDSKVWKHVHDLYHSFAAEPRNVHPTLHYNNRCPSTPSDSTRF